jgi:hypothetical protein
MIRPAFIEIIVGHPPSASTEAVCDHALPATQRSRAEPRHIETFLQSRRPAHQRVDDRRHNQDPPHNSRSPGSITTCSTNAANSYEQLSGSPASPARPMIAPSTPCARGSTRALESDGSRWGWRGKDTISSLPAPTNAAGVRRSTRAESSIRPRARRARAGSVRRGGPCRLQRAMR